MKLVNQDDNKVRYKSVGTLVLVGLPDYTDALRLPLQLLGILTKLRRQPWGEQVLSLKWYRDGGSSTGGLCWWELLGDSQPKDSSSSDFSIVLLVINRTRSPCRKALKLSRF